MYIRRKVFSLLQDENGEERYFSTTEFMNEDTYTERMFAKKCDEEDEPKKKKGLSKGAKIAIGAGAGTLGAAGLTYLGAKGIEKLAPEVEEYLEKKHGKGDIDIKKYEKLLLMNDEAKKKAKKVSGAMEAPFLAVGRGTKAGYKAAKKTLTDAYGTGKEATTKAAATVKKDGEDAIKATTDAGKKAVNTVKRKVTKK